MVHFIKRNQSLPFVTLIVVWLIGSSSLFAQISVTQVEGFLEVYLPSDTTSMYIGLNAGHRLFPVGNFNTFVGTGVGSRNGASFNSFFGSSAGFANTTGTSNSFYGGKAGFANTIGSANSFYGLESGLLNTTGSYNSFFGTGAGVGNTTGNSNSFFGQESGDKITTQSKIIAIGSNAGPANPTAADSMQLYIDVEETDTPLIFGDFGKDELTVYGKQLEISDDDTPTLRFDRPGGTTNNPKFDFEITMDGGDMIFQGGRNGSGVDLDTIMRIKANGNITGKVVEISDDDSPLLRFDRSGARFDFEITMDGPDMLFQGGKNGTGADLDTLVRIDDDGTITASGAINGSSDINRKESIIPIDSKSVLDKVANLPITEWQYKGSSDRHIGPMAQDFYAAFGLGQGKTTIATVDADGVAFAAIQALNKKLENKNHVLETEVTNLKERISKLEKLILAK